MARFPDAHRFGLHAASPGIAPSQPKTNAPVAQLDRALDYESRGQEFESLRARHFYPMPAFLSGPGPHPTPTPAC
jgi:hypothetical protein